jgi:hypothetical protein
MVAIEIDSPAIVRARLAREAMAESNNNRIRAVALYQQWLDEEPDLRAQLAPSFEGDAIAADIAGVDSSTRQQLRRVALRAAPDHPSRRPGKPAPAPRPAPNPDQGAGVLGLLVAKHEAEIDWHRWPLPGGQLLYEATPADVLLAARFYGQSETTSRVNRRFFELIHEAMRDGSCVGKVLPQAALLRLRRRAEEE